MFQRFLSVILCMPSVGKHQKQVFMGFYFSKRFFGGLIIRGYRIIYKTLTLFLIFPQLLSQYFFYGEQNKSLKKNSTDHAYILEFFT